MMDPSLSNSTPMDPLNTTDSSPCTLHLSSLASLTSVRSDRLPFCSLWHRCCSLAVALSSHSRRNLSLALSRLISVGLHGEESFVTQKFQHMCKFEMHVYLRFCLFNLNFRYMASRNTYIRRQTYTCVLQCCHASVGLTQACPNNLSHTTLLEVYFYEAISKCKVQHTKKISY